MRPAVCKGDLGRKTGRKKRYSRKQTQVDKRCGRRLKEARCEAMEKESIEQRGMGINCKGS